MRKILLSIFFILLFNYIVQADDFEISKKYLSNSNLKIKIENSQEIPKEIQNRLITKEKENIVLRIPLDLVETYKNQNYDVIGYYDEGIYYIYNDFYYMLEKEFRDEKIIFGVKLFIIIICLIGINIVLSIYGDTLERRFYMPSIGWIIIIITINILSLVNIVIRYLVINFL